MKLTSEQRTWLGYLAETMFPLTEWITDASHPVAPSQPVPWRGTTPKLTVADLNVVPFMESLLAGDDEEADEHLAEHWKIGKETAEQRQTALGRDAWRTGHSTGDLIGKTAQGEPLSPVFAFDPLTSANFILTHGAIPLTRGELYGKFLTHFLANYLSPDNPTASSENLKKWRELVGLLFTDMLNPAWPATLPKTSEFVKQFSKDVLQAMMNFRSGATHPFDEAIALEAGEGRRVGNSHSRGDAIDAVAAFQRRLQDAVRIP